MSLVYLHLLEPLPFGELWRRLIPRSYKYPRAVPVLGVVVMVHHDIFAQYMSNCKHNPIQSIAPFRALAELICDAPFDSVDLLAGKVVGPVEGILDFDVVNLDSHWQC